MEQKRRNSFYDNLYGILFPLVAAVCFLGAVYIKNIKLPIDNKVQTVTKIEHAQFLIQEPVMKNIPQPVKSIVKPKEIEAQKEIVDLTENPELKQEADDLHDKVPDVPVVKKVYGLKKVYSTGFGAGGSMSDAVIGKIGNTLNTPIDTFTASREEVRGQIVSTTTVTSAPQFVKIVKPEYNKEMIENKTEGVVKLKVLVDIDGKVKKATILSDLGFDSGAQALKATLQMEFTPARRGEERVAVWIIIPVRFVMIG